MNRLAHIPKAHLYRVYDAFLCGQTAVTPKVEHYRELTQDLRSVRISCNTPMLASIEPGASNRLRGSWVMILCEMENSGASSLSPIAYLRHDGTVQGVVRDYAMYHVNNLSLLVGNGDVLTVEIKRDEQGNVTRQKPIWRWGAGSDAGGGREVSTMDYLTISTPLMTQVYRFTKSPKPPGKP